MLWCVDSAYQYGSLVNALIHNSVKAEAHTRREIQTVAGSTPSQENACTDSQIVQTPLNSVENIRRCAVHQVVAHREIVPAGNDEQTISRQLRYAHSVELPGIDSGIGEMHLLQNCLKCLHIIWRRSSSIEQKNLSSSGQLWWPASRQRKRKQPNPGDELDVPNSHQVSTDAMTSWSSFSSSS